ncbi:hypothetical protein [Actinomycetospora cinnamomea]|uniref:hypothetical protein n=1 Tax=Actinomycetospora cinnamomea TaxID=663609 RepID=UPI00105807A8|nr:hypothetical protein [Actinomycetospora cinnamomea]
MTAGAPPSRRRGGLQRWLMLAGLAVSIFAIGLLASMAVEATVGRPLSGGTSGTSVGSLFGQPTRSSPVSRTAPSPQGTHPATRTSSPEQSSATPNPPPTRQATTTSQSAPGATSSESLVPQTGLGDRPTG